MSSRLRRKGITVVIAVFLISWVSLALGNVPMQINYQGYLTDKSGTPLSGKQTLTFLLYTTKTGGFRIWDEQQNVEVTDGVFGVQLGSVSPLSEFLFNMDTIYLEIEILSDGGKWETLAPRQQFISTAFAIKAGDADTLDGMDSADLDQSGHVTDTTNPHNVTATQIGALTAETDPTVPASIKDGITWTEVSDRPSGLDDGDNVGITEETDPTVPNSVKDGITWTEVAHRPAGLDDGDDVGITTETDPQVGTNTTSYVPRWNGYALVTGSVYDNGSRVSIGTTTPENAGLTVESAAGASGAVVVNKAGYPGETHGLNVTNEGNASTAFSYGITSTAMNDNYYAYAFFGNAQSSGSGAYGSYLDVDAAGSGNGYGIYSDLDHSGSGTVYGARFDSTSTTGAGYGLYLRTDVGSSTTTADAFGIRGFTYQYGSGSGTDVFGSRQSVHHYGSEGTAYGQRVYARGSETGDTYGVYSEGNKISSDTAGTAYGGYFLGNNDSSGGYSYGLYTQATGTNSRRYGLYSEVTTASAQRNYGVYSEVANENGPVYGFYGDVDITSHNAYGAYLDVDAGASATGAQYGLHVYVDHGGTSGPTYGVYSNAGASDSGASYGGYFVGGSSSGDTGAIFGVYAKVDKDTSGDKYAGYFTIAGGGDYAGYFEGNVNITGGLTASSKSFVQPHKSDPTKEIVFVSMEGPEHAVFIRGTAALEDGVAYLEMPEYWTQVAADEGITVNLTPEGQWAPLFVAAKSKEEIVVEVAAGGPMDAAFSYTVMALRDGFQDHEPIRENTHFTADGNSAWHFENRYTENTLDNMAIREMLMVNGTLNSDGSLNTQAAEGLGWKVMPNEEDSHYREAHGMEPLDAPLEEIDRPRPARPLDDEEPFDKTQEPFG